MISRSVLTAAIGLALTPFLSATAVPASNDAGPRAAAVIDRLYRLDC